MKFKNLKIHSIQVTLDGNREVHNLRRPHKNNLPTFDVILDNLVTIKEFLTSKVALRVNIDKSNLNSIKEVEEIIQSKGLNNFVQVYLGKIMDVNNYYNNASCYQNDEFAEIQRKFDFESKNASERIVAFYPKPQRNVCAADYCNSIVIDADGKMYKCYTDIGNDSCSFGNIKNLKDINKRKMSEFLLFDVTQDAQCSKCKLLPVCMGGCPKRRTEGRVDCPVKKYNLNSYMNYLPKILVEKNLKSLQ